MRNNIIQKDHDITSSQSSATSSWPALVIRCLKRPYLYLRPYPHAGKFSVAIESKKHDASLPKPPFPSAGSFSYKIHSNNNWYQQRVTYIRNWTIVLHNRKTLQESRIVVSFINSYCHQSKRQNKSLKLFKSGVITLSNRICS